MPQAVSGIQSVQEFLGRGYRSAHSTGQGSLHSQTLDSVEKGKRRLAKFDEPKANKSASKRLVKLDELANNFAIKREQSQTT